VADDPQGRGEAQLIEHLVGSVLSSVVKAQGLAASQLVDMVDKIGFEPATPGVSRKPRTFSFDFYRTELDPATNQIVRKQITATVPLLTLINLPAISIQEATIDMDLQLVAHEQASDAGTDQGALNLYVVPAKKQVVRTADQALVVDSAGTIKIHVVMRQESALGLDKIQSLLDSGTEEKSPASTSAPEALPPGK